MSGHEIVWTFDGDTVTGKAVCNDGDCLNRYVCEQSCEVYYDVRREADGSVTHAPWDDDSRQVVVRHRMHREDECNVAVFLNVDPGALPELHDRRGSFEIGRTPIVPVFVGDGLLWKRAVPVEAGGAS